MKPDKNERKLITDFYMWMVENDYNHNIRIRVENKAELFLRDRKPVKNLSLDVVSDSVAFADWINKNDYEKIHGDRWCKKYMSFTHSTQELYEMWSETER